MDERRTVAGGLETLEPGVRRILAPNPSPMTFKGTNTYVIGEGDVAVIDPGPADLSHMNAVLQALQPGETIAAILITHSHMDHSPLAAPLSAHTGAPIYAFGDSLSGRSCVMAELAADGLTGGGEGVDVNFRPDVALADGQTLKIGSIEVTALWTPGHMANHLSFAIGDAVFTGDVIMGWASTMISPPDGDLSAFLTSAENLAKRHDRVFYPGHGDPVTEPATRARWLIDHRRAREHAICASLDKTGRSIGELTQEIYTDVAPALLPAAERNVFAHLIALHTRNLVHASPRLSEDAQFFWAASEGP